jgi:hypothetical protein
MTRSTTPSPLTRILVSYSIKIDDPMIGWSQQYRHKGASPHKGIQRALHLWEMVFDASSVNTARCTITPFFGACEDCWSSLKLLGVRGICPVHAGLWSCIGAHTDVKVLNVPKTHGCYYGEWHCSGFYSPQKATRRERRIRSMYLVMTFAVLYDSWACLCCHLGFCLMYLVLGRNLGNSEVQ